MAKSINDMPNFWKSAQNEFFSLHPDIYEELMIFVGGRITDIRKDEIKEEDYLKQWKDKELICI